MSSINDTSTDEKEQNDVLYHHDSTEKSHLIANRNPKTTFPSINEETSLWAAQPDDVAAAGVSSNANINNNDTSTPNIFPPNVASNQSFIQSIGVGNASAGTPSVPLSETATSTYGDDETLSAWEGSYAGHLHSQSTLARKWLNDTDIEPYIRIPNAPRGSGVGKGRREAGRKHFFREPLLEELLPSSRKETLFPAIHGPVTRKDALMAYIYGFLMGLMLLIGSFLLSIYPKELWDSIIRSSTMLRAIIDSSWILIAAIVVGSIASIVWMVLLRWFTPQIVNLMVYFAPSAMFLAGFWAAVEFLHSDPGGGFWLLVISIASLVSSTLLATYLVSQRKEISHTINIIRMATEVLTMNPGILLASVALFVVYLAFVVVWLVFFSHTLMLGHVDAVHKVWILSKFSYYLQFFFVVMLLWTSIIFSYLQKAVIGGVLGRWYFFRTDTDPEIAGPLNNFALESFRVAIVRFFGQICFASLVISTVRCTRMVIRGYKLLASRLENGILSAAIRSANLFFGFLERFLEHVSDLAIYVVVLTGDNFWSSSRSVFKIFRRNMIVGFTTDMVAQLIFMTSTTAAAIVVGLSSYFFIAHVLQSSYGFNGAIIYGMVIWIDSAFVCYAIDLDTEKLHSSTVHQAFSHRTVSEPPI